MIKETIGNNVLFVYCFCIACGGTLEQPSGIIESPGYPLTNHYDRDCEWKIIVPKGRRIKLELLDIDIDESSSFHEQGLVLFTGNVRLAHILPYKLKSTNVQNIRTTDNTGIIYFWSHHVSNHRGFRISFSSDEPTGISKNSHVTICVKLMKSCVHSLCR